MSLESRPVALSGSNPEQFRKKVGNALTDLIKNRGYRNRYEFQGVINAGRNHLNVFEWTSGKSAPSVESMSLVLQTLKPEGEDLDRLIDPWSKLLQIGAITRSSRPGSEGALRISRRIRKQPTNPFGEWIDRTADALKIQSRELVRRLGFSKSSTYRWRVKTLPSIEILSLILQRAKERLNLTQEQQDDLANSVSRVIEEEVLKGKGLQSSTPGLTREMKKEAKCEVFTGSETGEKLHVSRERIRQLRNAVGIEHTLLTKEDLRRITRYRRLPRGQKHKM